MNKTLILFNFFGQNLSKFCFFLGQNLSVFRSKNCPSDYRSSFMQKLTQQTDKIRDFTVANLRYFFKVSHSTFIFKPNFDSSGG